MIHVCFALYDKTRTYSRFTGTAMLSLFENHDTPPHLPSITVHLLHDNTLTNENRDKLIQIAERYGQSLKFYNVEELCADRLAEVEENFSNIRESIVTIGTLYRFLIEPLLLPQGIDKAIYLDSDIIVNLDIAELWQIELGDKPLGVVPEKNNGVPIKDISRMIRTGAVKEEDYFNAGILLMNLKVLHEEEANIKAGMEFISKDPQFWDQDVLNYCFAASSLKLPIKFNYYVRYARARGEFDVSNKLLHYIWSVASLPMNMHDTYSRFFMDYFIKTPWIDDDTRLALNGGISPRRNYLISVVIPMFNVEEFIAECLESLLIQTFQDFEVIVVDDCSTDNSVKVVESYAPKFNGRLKLTKTETNSGGGGKPRNIGMTLARGDYLFFLDADDMILGNALETLYKAALLYDAEVVYTSSQYLMEAPNKIRLYQDNTTSKLGEIQTEFTFDDPTTNLNRLLLEPNEGNFNNANTKFVKRDFVLKNEIFFPKFPLGEDLIWVIEVYCHVRRFLRIATPFYFYKHYNTESVTHKVRPPSEQVTYWFSEYLRFCERLYELEKKYKLLAENPLYALSKYKNMFIWTLWKTREERKELGNEEIYKILRNEFAKSYPDSSAVLLPFLFSFIDNEKSDELLINKCKPFITARIDVKLMTTEGDFQILAISDNKARVSKPYWLQNDGIGYQIESYAGQLDFTLKTTVDGKTQLKLRGLDIRTPEDNSKRIPYWIDYTKFIINDKMIFDKLTPAWHDKPYVYNMEVKAGEEIKIHVEWQPHRSDT